MGSSAVKQNKLIVGWGVSGNCYSACDVSGNCYSACEATVLKVSVLGLESARLVGCNFCGTVAVPKDAAIKKKGCCNRTPSVTVSYADALAVAGATGAACSHHHHHHRHRC